MSSSKLYSDAVRSGSSDEDVVSPGRDIFDWLHAYQQESEEVALQKSLQLSKALGWQIAPPTSHKSFRFSIAKSQIVAIYGIFPNATYT
jgi:hypothetical protein